MQLCTIMCMPHVDFTGPLNNKLRGSKPNYHFCFTLPSVIITVCNDIQACKKGRNMDQNLQDRQDLLNLLKLHVVNHFVFLGGQLLEVINGSKMQIYH